MDTLNAFGEQLRDAVRDGAGTRSSSEVWPVLGEADRRLGQPLVSSVPPFVLTTGAAVHRAQNLARLVTGLLSALDAAPSDPPRLGGNTHNKSLTEGTFE
ncbi:hypothetical protein ACFWPP_11645 [Streptomyces anulatus]|uniref:hypothetical protein n=1 Tax=Streptomyces anulatus TaxID=1892 RepID=UPI003647A817